MPEELSVVAGGRASGGCRAFAEMSLFMEREGSGNCWG